MFLGFTLGCSINAGYEFCCNPCSQEMSELFFIIKILHDQTKLAKNKLETLKVFGLRQDQKNKVTDLEEEIQDLKETILLVETEFNTSLNAKIYDKRLSADINVVT